NIATGATVKGIGTFSNGLTLQGTSATTGGTISLGNSDGTLTAGSIAVSGGGKMMIELDGGSADLLGVTNTAALSGSAINLSVLSPPSASSYVIVSAGTLSSMPVLNPSSQTI